MLNLRKVGTMFIDIYAIQSVPPSNINRDDTGAPKTALYGGVRRARVSSQAWKRAAREEFPKYLPEESLGIRTKFAAELLAQKIVELDAELEDRSAELVSAVLGALGIKVETSKRAGDDEGKNETKYLIFFGRGELDALARIAASWAEEGKNLKKLDKAAKEEAKSAFKGAKAVDIALFGRMLADVPELNTDASCQVAHAISVDRVTQEFDYFTAIDDCASGDNAGASMIDTVDYNSSTLYRYANINIDALREQLADTQATAYGVRAFLEAFVRSMPTGKQNSFANRTLPSCVLVSMREEQPFNAVSAYEVPVSAGEDSSISHIAAERLGECIAQYEKEYDMRAQKAWYVSVDGAIESLDAIAEKVTLAGLVENVSSKVEAAFGAGE